MKTPRTRLSPYFLVIFLLLRSHNLFSQTFAYDPAYEKKIGEAITTRYKQDLQSIKGENKKYITDLYEERFKYIDKRIKAKSVLTDQKAQKYLNNLGNEIFKSNPSLPAQDIRLLFERTFYPNASSMGEGTIFFNIGLFHRLDNESQAAFIICHEIAHYYLNHSNDNIAQYVNTIYSKEFQKQLKAIQKSDYQQNSQLENLGKNLLFRTRRHSREFEQSADSMALELMKNTNYDLSEVLTCLALLDSVDKMNYSPVTSLEKRFQFQSYSFKKSWLDEENGLVLTSTKKDIEKEKKEQDSLKTHPDCSLRIERLKKSINNYQTQNAQKFLVDKELFNELKSQFQFEAITYTYESGNISRSLFLALELLEKLPDDVYVHTMIGKCLNTLYAYQKNHGLDKIVDRPNPREEASYNTVLHFIQNLRLQEIASLSYYFLKQDESRFSSDKEFAEVFRISMRNLSKTE